MNFETEVLLTDMDCWANFSASSDWEGRGGSEGREEHGRWVQGGRIGQFSAYILKADVLDVWTPQKIQIFRRKFVWERENYQSQSLEANNSAMCYK